MDFASELGCLGFTMRLKRLSDTIIHDGRKKYKSLGMDIEPNWYVVLRLLEREKELSIMEIADRVMLSHPSIITMTNKMMKKGYISSSTSEKDNRKRVLKLTEKAIKALPELNRVWNAGERGIIKALEGTDAMAVLKTLEERFFNKGFKDRTLEELA